jgi:23S rRNA pseudouridine2605 synthase
MKPRRPDRSPPEKSRLTEGEEVRLNRFISQAGVASRRKADEMIAAGLVRINGEVVTEMGTRVNPSDRVEVNGRLVSQRSHIYLLLNKPPDTITTTSDERGRRTVLDLVALPDDERAGLYPVGRLDRHTTGALVLTNDGELAHRLMHPSYEVEKVYRIRTRDVIKPHHIEKLLSGVELEDGMAVAREAGYVDAKDMHELGMAIHEGRNRQVRRMMEALGHEVVELERVVYAGLTVEGVRRGKWRRLKEFEIRRLRRLVKLK